MVKKIKLLIITFSLIAGLTNCLFLLAPNPDDKDHQKIFELLYNDLKKYYVNKDNLLSLNGVNTLEGVYKKFENRLKENKLSHFQFAGFLREFEDRIADPHFYFDFGSVILNWLIQNYENPYNLLERNGVVIPPTSEDYTHNYIDYLKKDLKSPYFYGTVSDSLHSGNKIGYIAVNKLLQNLSGIKRITISNEDWILEVDNIIEKFNDLSIQDIIIDIRNFADGSTENARLIASRFVNNGERTFAYSEARKNDDSFTTTKLSVAPDGKGFRKGKIIIIANVHTLGSGEMLTLALRQRKNTIQVGNNTKGCIGEIIAKDLANGWLITMTSSKTYYPDPKSPEDQSKKKSYFRIGIPADDVILYSSTDQVNEKDKEIERAINLLKDNSLFQTVYDKIERYK